MIAVLWDARRGHPMLGKALEMTTLLRAVLVLILSSKGAVSLISILTFKNQFHKHNRVTTSVLKQENVNQV